MVGWRATGAVTWPIVGLSTAVALWWAATNRLGVESFLLPPPQEVAATLARLPGYLAHHSRITVVEVGAGFLLAVGVGIPGGLLLASVRPVRQATSPLLVILHALPKLPLAVPLVIAFGFGTAPKVIMVVLVCVFPIVISTVAGLHSTPAELAELARSLCASRWQAYRKIRLPYALPQIFTGLRTAAPLAVVGAVIGELFGAVAGLGFVIRGAGTDLALVWAVLLLLGALSLALFYLLAAVERLLAPWAAHLPPRR